MLLLAPFGHLFHKKRISLERFVASCQVHPRQKQPLKLAIILAAHEFESLRLRFSDYGLAVWQVLFV